MLIDCGWIGVSARIQSTNRGEWMRFQTFSEGLMLAWITYRPCIHSSIRLAIQPADTSCHWGRGVIRRIGESVGEGLYVASTWSGCVSCQSKRERGSWFMALLNTYSLQRTCPVPISNSCQSNPDAIFLFLFYLRLVPQSSSVSCGPGLLPTQSLVCVRLLKKKRLSKGGCS